jgi:outer membrane protein assembly factor BamB
MAGGNPSQQNIAKSVVEPPLELLWTYNCEAGIGYSAVSVADAVVFLNNLQGEMHTIDISSGGKIGQINFLGKEAGTTPLIDGNDVYLSFAGEKKYSLVSYNLMEGKLSWRRNLGYLQTSPIMEKDYIYTGSLNGKFYKVNKTSGGIAWTFDAKDPIHSTCAISENRAVFGTDKGFIYCVNINSGTEIWKFKAKEAVFSTPLIFDGKVFIGSYDSNYYCIDISNGSKVWSRNLSTKILSGSTLYRSNSVIFGGVDGNLYSLNVNDGSLNWKYGTKGVITATPLNSGKCVYFSSHDWHAYCVDGADGKLIWKYELQGRGKTTPVVWNNLLFLADDKRVYCFSRKIQ